MSSLLSPFAAGGAASVGSAGAAPGDGRKPLVTYFTRSGNTPTIAGLFSRDLQAALFQIEPAPPYPADYYATAEQGCFQPK